LAAFRTFVITLKQLAFVILAVLACLSAGKPWIFQDTGNFLKLME
jgi:hypothetical protein